MGVNHTLVYLLFLLSNLLYVNSQEIIFAFSVGSQFQEINEEEPVGKTILDIDVQYIDAHDIPRGESYGSYSYVAGFDESYFNLDSATGTITNAAILDRDRVGAQITFNLRVNFTANDGFSDIVDLTIALLDINDNTPSFNQSEYEVTVPEKQAPGTSFFQAIAFDPDQVLITMGVNPETLDFITIYVISNGRVIYTIDSGNEDGQFMIHPDNGMLSIAAEASLDVDEQNFYNLTVIAEDGGSLTNSTRVLITIIDSNDNNPVIHYPSSFSLSLSEDTQSGMIVLDYINASDADSGINAEILFAILEGDVTNSFTINETSGAIELSDGLDREAGNPLILTIAAVDQGIPKLMDTFTITITLLDINDRAPEFSESEYQFSISESAKIGSTVGQVVAEDLDDGDNGVVFYYLASPSNEFDIDNSTGDIITTIPILDRETTPYYELIVEAIDNPNNKSLTFITTVLVNITLTDVNDNYPIWAENSYTVGILDTESPGYSLITLQATDLDIGTNAQLQYEFFEALDSVFVIDSTTGEVTLNDDIDFHTKSEYSYTIRAYDATISPLDAFVELAITVHVPNNKAPVFDFPQYNTTISEDTVINAVVLNVSATDKDSGLIGEVHYRIPSEWQFTDSGSFDVDRDTGGVFVNGTLDYDFSDDLNYIFFQVEAYDGGFPEPFTDRTNITIFLTNTNDEAPIISFPLANIPTIPENMPPEVEFATLADFTNDPDPGDGGIFNFSLVAVFGDYDDNDSFLLSSEGILTSLRLFDREAQPAGFILSILTTDFGTPTQSIINNITVLIGDTNDQYPFYEYSANATVYEFQQPGEIVYANYSAVDYDIGINAVLDYAIMDGDTTNSFAIDNTGTITTTKILDKNEQRYYNLTIIVMDNGLVPLFGYGEVFIEVLDANDNTPQFDEPLIASFFENDEPGTIFYQLNATDSDEGTNSHIAYFLSNETIHNVTYFNNETNATVVRFLVDELTGNVSIGDLFNREVEYEFELTVIAVDRGQVPFTLNTSATLSVLIQDDNDNTPEFLNDSYAFYVTENEDLSTSIGRVFAEDLDATYPNNGIVFSLFGNRSDSIAVDPDSGLVYVNGTLDWEKGPDFTIDVVASDLGYPQRSSSVDMTIFIEDINDRAPEWNITSLNLSISENLVPGSSVGYIMAIDPDSEGNNSLVFYDIAMDFSSKHFELNSTTGEITTLKVFNREKRDLFDLIVVAFDSGTPQQSTTATVYIEILDANDRDPYFLQPVFSASISENTENGTHILSLYAQDDDIDINGLLTYSIVSSKYAFYFRVNETTGNLYTNTILDYESINYFEFQIIVTDGGIPQRNDTAIVVITITNYNDMPPNFSAENYTVTIVENIAVGTNILRVFASDNDSLIISFSLLQTPYSDYFEIDSETGVLYTVEFINREELGSNIQLTIIANNSNDYENPLASIVPVDITILDLNDQAPSFEPYIKVSVYENNTLDSIFYTLTAEDGDEGHNGTILYEITYGNDNNTFSLNQTSGELKLLKELDYESQRYFYIGVNATDQGDKPLFGYTTIIIEVQDSNDNSPQFAASTYTTSVGYTASIDDEVLTVSAADQDIDTNADKSYSIISGNPNDLFTIASTTGTITVHNSLTSYSGSLINFTIQATDGYFNTTADITIHIRGSGGPRFTALNYNEEIEEGYVDSSVFFDMYSQVIPANSANVFSIVNGNENEVFNLAIDGGLTVDGSKLDFETKAFYQLSVSVENSGLTSYAIVNIDITDVNEFTPLFTSTSFFTPVFETITRRDPFFIMIAEDNDGSSPANKISYSIVSGNDDTTFHLNSNTGELSLDTLLDYNSNERQYTLNITAENKNSAPFVSSWAIVQVALLDGNKHLPLFDPSSYSTFIDENTEIGSQTGIIVKANDDDYGMNGEITYALLGNHRHYDFQIDPKTGNITVGPGGLDRERIGLYILVAVASDSGVPQQSATAAIQIAIIDVNDNTPVWEQELYEVVLHENTTIGTEIIQVLATDLDQVDFVLDEEDNPIFNNKNGYVTYSITAGDTLSQFSIEFETFDPNVQDVASSVSIMSELDREMKSEYNLTLTATDGGGISTDAYLHITILDINDVIPKFASEMLTASVYEDAVVGLFVTQTQAVDEDLFENSNISYSIVSGNVNDTFTINSTSADLYLNRVLDREEIMVYSLVLEAVDNGIIQLTGFATLEINVLDVNEFAPQFSESNYTVEIDENEPYGYSVFQVNATDQDTGDNAIIVYSITAGNSLGLFEIQSETGIITVAKPIDYEYIMYHTLIITASDSAHPNMRLSSEVNLTIYIRDINDNAPIFANHSYEAQVFENAEPSIGIVTINAVDNDDGVNMVIEYFLHFVSDDGAESSFVIDNTTGLVNLSTSPTLDFETIESYTFSVVAIDKGSPPLSSNVSLTIFIEDTNDNIPVFTKQLYNFSVSENLPSGQSISQVEASDADSNKNGEVLYSIIDIVTTKSDCFLKCPNATDICDSVFTSNFTFLEPPFTIDNYTGIVYSSIEFDRETIEEYVVIVEASDLSVSEPKLSSSSCIYIKILDKNDETPQFLFLPYNATVIEEAIPGVLAFTVTTTDNDIDANAMVEYEIEEGSGFFTIHPTNGEIRTLVKLDREEKDAHNITVIVKDKGSVPNTASAVVYINVDDINDSPPLFTQEEYNISLAEDVDTKSFVYKVVANDDDIGPNSELMYNITSIIPELHFGINSTTGDVFNTVALDRETISSYNITIQVTDKGFPAMSSTSVLVITVNDINDNPPEFIEPVYRIVLSENISYSEEVITVHATDDDENNNSEVFYYVSAVDPPVATFTINETTGELYLETKLDAELLSSINVTIRADNGLAEPIQYSYTTVIINITNINDVMPKFDFSEYKVLLKEDSPIGTSVLKPRAIDLDSVLEYDIINSTNATLFDIDPLTGLITVNGELDRDMDSFIYIIVVVVQDGGDPLLSDTTTVTIILTDVNDNPPMFEQTSYSFTILENKLVDTEVGQVHATDSDSQNVTYLISNSTEDGKYYSIDAVTGIIVSTVTFDREVQEMYSFIVLAVDDPVNGSATEVSVNVTILDVNDNKPVFTNDTYIVYWPEDTPIDTQLNIVEALDPDSDTNSISIYSIAFNEVSDFFYINASSGEIYLSQTLDRENYEELVITVIATDALNDQLNSSAQLVVRVLDINDNIPIFNQTLYTSSVLENSEFDTKLVTVSASDVDINENSELSFSISTEVEDFFSINAYTGELRIAGNLDYEYSHNYTIPVFVTDHGSPSLNSSSEILIEVVDVNDNSPYFEQESYQIFVPENSVLSTSVFKVPAIDIDDGFNAQLQYSILSGNIGFRFALNEETGILTVEDYIDFEIKPYYLLTVRVVDLGVPQHTAGTTIIVNITDVNDNSPHFSSTILSASIPEDSELDYEVVTLTATDDDTGSNAALQYAITSGNHGDAFRIDNSTSSIYVNGNLDFESRSSYSLTVVVSDSGYPKLTDTATLVISLTDVNEYTPELYAEQYSLNISQAIAIGTPIAYLTAVDSDRNTDSLSYNLMDSDSDSIAITPSGKLYVSNTLSTGSVKVSIEISDGVHSSTVLVDITVHPQFYTGPLFETSTYTFEESESSSINTIVGTLTLSSEVTSIHFVTENGELASTVETFQVNFDGEITLISNLDYENIPYYVLNVQALGVEGEKVFTIVTIFVIDSNDNPPIFDNDEFSLTLSELTIPSTSVIKLSTNDLDSPGINSETSLELVGDDEYFSIDSLTQSVILIEPLNREVSDTVILIVNASNHLADPILYSIVTITITVVDENDNNPEFDEVFYRASVFGSTSLGTKIITVTANDLDKGSNSELVYSITYQSSSNAFSIIRANGTIISNKDFSEEVGSTITVSLLVSDFGNPSPRTDTTTLFVSVLKDNLYSPIFSQLDGYSALIEETINIGVSILQVSATDGDSNDIFYSINAQDSDVPFFISSSTGTIYLSSSLDYVLQSVYYFKVIATDSGTLARTAETQINITIIDVNNHSPEFSQNSYEVDIIENIRIGSFVLQVNASDVDAVSLVYTITVNHQQNDINTFSINDTTGMIYTAAHINREANPTIELLVSAIDTGYSIQRSTSIPIYITVNDINDEIPLFNQTEYNISVIRLLPAGQVVATISAYDIDIVSKDLIYAIESQTIEGLFSIHSSNGIIKTNSTVPEDVMNNTVIIVSAYDGNQTSNVSVLVSAVNDGTFCEDGFCTTVTARSLMCNYAIPDYPICATYCNEGHVPCTELKQCLPTNKPCNGMCPSGQSVCPTTDICYSLSHDSPCDTNTCLIGQTLIQYDNDSRSCALTSTLPVEGQLCSGEGMVYCEGIDLCSNLTAPQLCKLCPEEEVACSDTKECVSDIKYCCGYNAYYCQVLDNCLAEGTVCKLPNIPPSLPSDLIYFGLLDSYSPSDNGQMVGLLLGSNDSLGVDSQGEEIGIAITAVANIPIEFGEWQYALCDGSLTECQICSSLSPWVTIDTSFSESFALFLPSTACIRFWRKTIKLEGAVWLRTKAWDGNMDGFESNSSQLVRFQSKFYGSTLPFTSIGSVSESSTLLTALLLPLSEPPIINSNSNLQLSSIYEDVRLEDNTGDSIQDIVISVSTVYLPVLTESIITGLPSVDENKMEIYYEDLLPAEVKNTYFQQILDVNPSRKARLDAQSTGQNPGVAVSISDSTKNGHWQVSPNGDSQLYVYISDILGSSEQVLLLNTTALLRYLPSENFNGEASIAIYAWDGVIPDSSMQHVIHNVVIYTTTQEMLSPYHINDAEYASIMVVNIVELPSVIQSTVQLTPLPYTIKYTYDSVFTALISQEMESLVGDNDHLEDILFLVLNEPVIVHRLYPASDSSSTYMSFYVKDDVLNLTEIMYLLDSKQETLISILPITMITQDGEYGAGAGCHENVPGTVSGDKVYSLASQIAIDTDDDFLGFAVIEIENGKGVWQYARGDWNKSYVDLTDSLDIWINFPAEISETTSIVLHGNDKLRYIPRPLYYWQDSSSPTLTVKVWDGSEGALGQHEISRMNINTNPYVDTLQSLYNPVGYFSELSAVIEAMRFGCDEGINSAKVHDSCCICGGNGNTCNGCDNTFGSNKVYDSCDVCDGTDTTCLGCDSIPLSFSETGSCSECISELNLNSIVIESLNISTSFKDCSNMCFGEALIDDCRACSGGNTNHDYNSDKDCFGQCYGTNVIDDCGYCTGSETELIFNQHLDCTGVCDGPFKSDSCEICQLPGEDGVVTEYADCNGDCFGTASMDSCGVCYGGNTGQLANTTIDQCSVCNGNDTTCYGCDGAVNSGIKIDNCGVCGGNDCGCQHIVMVSPNRGPSKGGTSITITGSGFFRNGSYYDPLVPNCGAPQTDSESKSIPVSCSFVIDDETAIGSAYIANQSTIICITPSVANPNTEFSLSVSVDNGPLTDPIIFYFESYADVSIESYTPTKGHLNTKTTITFSGTNLINTSDVACLVSNMESCGNNEVIDSNGYHIIPAQYIDTSTVSCTLPASSSPCQVTVQLSLDGQASGIIEYVDFDGLFTYAYSAPVVNSIHFVDNITSLVIEFDRAIEISDGLELTCNNIFSNSSLDLLSTEALCFWQNSAFNALLITLPVTASVEIDLPISFKDNTINTKDKLYSFSHSDKIRVSSTINNIHPVAIIEGPSSIPFCGQARYSAINSLYPGYKRFIYKWSVYTYNSSIPGLINIVNMFNALPLTTAEIEIPISLFQISTTYVIQATVTNALGLSDTSSITVIKDTSKSLQIAISSAEDIVLKHEQDVLLQSHVINEGCTNFNEFDFNWSLYKLVDVRRMTFNLQDLTEVHTNNPILHIPARYFQPEDSYRIQLNVQTTNGVYTASKSININVQEKICIARIHGGDKTLSQTQMLVLDASTSTILSEYFPNFIWQCSVVGSGIPCYNATFKESTRTIKLPQQQLVTIPVSNLQADYRYNFTVLLTQGLCKSSATVIIEIVQPTDPIATIQILTPSHVITSSQKVVIEGLVYTTNPVTVSWSCLSLPDQEYIDLQNGDVTSSPTKYKAVVQSDIESQTNIVIIGKASRANLVIKPNILTVSRPYTFQLLAEYEDQFVSTQVTIIPNGPPVIHTFSVTPTSGVALSTKFKLLVDRVTDDIDDYPLRYQYGLVRSDTIYWLSGLMTEKYIDVLLPHGSNLKVVVRIYDSFGEYSDSFANVDVSENPSVDYDSFIQGLANNLQSRHEWTAVLSSLVSALDSFEDNDISIISLAIDLYIDIFNNYTPFTLEHLFLHLTTVELISSKMPEIGSNDKLLLLNSVIKVLDMMISDVEGNFKLPDFDSFSESDGILRSDRYNVSNFYEPLDSRSLQALMNIKSNLLSSNWNSNIASKSREITQKLNEILCRQTVLGEDRILLNSEVQDFLFMKAIPFGSFNITNKGTIDFATTIEELYNQQACSGTNTNTACSEMCFQISSYTKDYFSNSDQIITLSSSTQEVIISTIEGSDPLNVQLYSNILTVDLSLPTRNGVIEVENLDSSIRVYIPVSSALPDDSSIPLCLYRDTKTLSNDQWQFDTLQTPDQAVLNGITYYLCEYNHLSEFAIGLLPPPIIIIPTSSTFSAISSPSPSQTTSESTSETSSPSPIVPVQSQVGNNIGPIIGGVVVVLLFVIVMVVVFILVAFVVWRKKQSGKLKIAPASSESIAPSEKQVALEERSKTPDEAKKVHLGVIQLLKNGDRLVLGSVNVAMSTRLRELRNQLTDNFDSLKKKPFYLCTKELSDIEPATEQQQFVSIVYSNIVYIRDVTADNKDFKRQFCTCSKVAQFECSSCNERGYCSKECQQKHWDTGHQKECRRFSERRNRSDILLRRQTSSGTLLPDGQSVTETVDITKSPRQSLGSPTNWKGFLNQSRAYQQLPSISPRPQNLSTTSNLPPLTRQPLIQPIDETLRETLDSDIVTSEPKSQTSPVQPKLSTRPPLPRLASTGHVSIGQLASQTPTQSGQLPISPRTLVTPISPPPVAPMSSYFTSTPLYGSYDSQQLQLQQLQQSYAQQQLAQSYAPVAPMTSYYNSTPSNDRYDSRELEQLQQLQQSYTQQQLAQSYAQRRVGQVSLKYSPQTPFFSRPSVTSLETQTPQLRRDISISSIQSDILNMSKTGTGLRRDIRNEPLLELEHESSSTTSGSEEDDKKGEEDQVSTQTSRPPSLAIRRRHSSRMSFKENSTMDQKYDSTDSDDSSDEDSDDEQ